MSRFEKHIGAGKEIEIEGEKYTLKPLGTESIGDFFKAMKAFSRFGKDTPLHEALAGIDDAGLDGLRRLIDATLARSFPEEWRSNQDEVKAFGMKYMMVLLPAIVELNSAEAPTTHEEVKKDKLLQRLSDAGYQKQDTGQ